MVDASKHIHYWTDGAVEAWEDAEALLEKGRYRFGAFVVHLALEKILKAHVTRATRDVPPRSHDLTMLAKRTELELSDEQKSLLDLFNQYQLEGRYPEAGGSPLDRDTVMSDIERARTVFQWLKQQL